MKQYKNRLNELMMLPDRGLFGAELLLQNDIRDCHKCSGLNIPQTTMSASGYGKIPAELMVIGQSLHGYNPETPDRQIPFIGPVANYDSGNLLYEILEQAGYAISYGNLFVTNIVKCHPPRNRASLTHEQTNCQPFLLRELELVKPKIILTVGSDARRAFRLNEKGKFIEFAAWERKTYKSHVPISTYYVMIKHPSFIMRYTSTGARKRYIKKCVEVLKQVKGRL